MFARAIQAKVFAIGSQHRISIRRPIKHHDAPGR
jgi:hypothetical protein